EAGIRLDLSSSGRGQQQTLLLLAYLYANSSTVLLLDEPDAHLEILRQRQIYQLLSEVAAENGNQIIAASHSEVLLNEAADRDVVIAFVGKPHRIDDRGSQVLKALKEIGFEQYYQAEQTGWVLYVEGSTDLAILRAFAKLLGHQEAQEALARPFVHYVADQPGSVLKHFHGVREALPGLRGIALFDQLDRQLPDDMNAGGLQGLTWRQREIENYLCCRETLVAYAKATARQQAVGPLFEEVEINRHTEAMNSAVAEVEQAMATLEKGSPWDPQTKVSDDFLTPVFRKYFDKLGQPNIMAKTNFHELAPFVPVSELDPEIGEKLDAIVQVAKAATPRDQST
ncbi:AAA family ATPase, partial [Candidatus Sumerlaeota bacterium]